MTPTESEIEARQLEAFLTSVSRSVVGIVGKQNGEFGKGIGTGNLIQVDGKPHILTAAHVIEGCSPEELRFLMPGNMEIQERNPGEKARIRPKEVFPREPLIVKSSRIDTNLDVAALELSDIYLAFPNLTFRDIVPAPPVPAPGRDTVMMGFPARQAQPYGANFMVLQFVEYPRVADPGHRLLANFNPDVQFLVDYPAADDYDPAGFSGSALWGQKEQPGLWQPDPRLLGMVLGYYRNPKLLYAISAPEIAAYLGA
jgi:hypothetical protein